VPVQYLNFVSRLVHGDFGSSFQYRVPVRDLYFQRLPMSLELAFAAFMVSLCIGIPLGIVTAVKVDTGWDTGAKIIAMLGLSIPGFFVGLVLISSSPSTFAGCRRPARTPWPISCCHRWRWAGISPPRCSA
jgi:peptide/nickel transport system permease protein